MRPSLPWGGPREVVRVRHPWVLLAGVAAAAGTAAWRRLAMHVDQLELELVFDDLRFTQTPPDHLLRDHPPIVDVSLAPRWLRDPTTREGIVWAADGWPVTEPRPLSGPPSR
jgi:hypothetical protein